MEKDFVKLDNEQCDDDFEKKLQEFLDEPEDTMSEEEETPDSYLQSVGAAQRNLPPSAYALSVCVMEDDEQRRYTKGTVSVHIFPQDGFKPDTDRFKCYVYTDTHIPVCSSQTACKVLDNGNELTYEISSSCVWMPGDYLLFVRDKDGTLVRLPFHLDDQLETSFNQAFYTPICDKEDILLAIIDQEDAWQQLAVLPGTGQMRRRIMETRQHAIYNEMRCGLGAKPIGFNMNYLICTRNKDWTELELDAFRKQVAESMPLEYVDCGTLYDAACNNPYEHLGELLVTHIDQIMCLTNLTALSSTGGKIIVKRLLDKLREPKGPRNKLWLCGSRQEIDGLFEQFPSMKEFFVRDSWVEQEPYTAYELVQTFFRLLKEEHLEPTEELTDMVTRAIISGHKDGALATWSVSDIRRLVVEDIRPQYMKRALSNFDFNDLPLLLPEDVDTSLFVGNSDTFEKCIGELNDMVGLDEVKQGIITMANNSRFYQERRRRGLPTSQKIAFHCIFTGNPGTGKTTVARQLGRIYRSLGLLSKGEVMAVDRTKLVGRYIGETEENMKAVLEEARGNVLFIDEAYNLYDGSGDRKDFGARVIDSLLTVLSQPNPDMLVVFAGYLKEMDAMLNTNPGLMGRFPYKYQFNDYDAAQLLQIANGLLSRDEYILSEEAERLLRESIELVYKARPENFSNARWVEQFVNNGIIPAMANRLALSPGADYQHIEAADVRKAYERFNVKAFGLKPRRKVGFGA